MTERTVTIVSAIGLHARPASLFCRAVADAGVDVTITAPSGRSVNAASILGVLSLGIDHGQTVTLAATGEGADRTLDALVALLTSDLDQQ